MHKQVRNGNASISRFYMQSEVAKNTCNFRSLSVSGLGNSTAIKPVLQQQLITVMGLSAIGIRAADFPKGAELMPRLIPMHRLSDDARIVYRSAIALKLAPLAQRPALDIANQLVALFPTSNQNTTESMCLDFSVEVVSPGWINFRLSEQSLATWLQHLVEMSSLGDGELGEQGKQGERGSSEMLDRNHREQLDKGQKSCQNLFLLQYAHARCCSLLRLAYQQGLIKLRDLDFKTLSLIEPHPIPWLNDDHKTNTGQMRLQLVHPAERRLIVQILDLLDEISDSEQRHLGKLAIALYNAFENFYSSCRIWGEVKTQTPKLAQARLGLVGVTQVSLRSLLQNQLGVEAPVEL